jgi:hypothetical protein
MIGETRNEARLLKSSLKLKLKLRHWEPHSLQGMLEYPNKILNTSIGNILKYHYQYGFSNNTGPVSVFCKDT